MFYTFIWKFCPQLITDGHIYAAVSPLYRIIKSKESIYLKDDNALADYRQKHANEKYELARFKGLGEMSAEELAESTMSPESRTLRQLHAEDMSHLANVLTNLMGDAVTPRKQFIETNAFRANITI